MIETLTVIIHAIKLLRHKQAESAETLLKQEITNIHRKFILSIISSKEIVGEPQIKALFEEAQKYLEVD